MSSTFTVRPSTVRLTRRGRAVVFVLALLVVLSAFWVLSGGSSATERPEPTQVMVVGTGDTLWDIASDHTDDGDVRAMMAHIKDLNDLESAALQAGQQLRVPA